MNNQLTSLGFLYVERS